MNLVRVVLPILLFVSVTTERTFAAAGGPSFEDCAAIGWNKTASSGSPSLTISRWTPTS